MRKVFLILIFIFALVSTLWILKSNNFCANSISCIKDLSGKYDTTQMTGEYLGRSIIVPSNLFAKSDVLAVSNHVSQKKILVNLTTQELFAYESDKLKYKFKISSGKFYPTPVGKFYIWIKLLATPMEGGERENKTYYRLPNVPYTMFFYNENVDKGKGYGIHGMYWYSDFGQPSTHGCIGLRVEDAEKLFYWTNPQPKDTATFVDDKDLATPIIVFGKADAGL